MAGPGVLCRLVTFRPDMLRGASSGAASGLEPGGHVDYRLARNMVVSEFRKGRLSRPEVCDAHPELLRAALNVGQPSPEDCPICEESKVVLVSYVFGNRLPPSGRCVTSQREMLKLSRSARQLACYVVEVCPSCSWNHLARSYTVGRGGVAAD
jgi:hypothetical protein